GLRRVAAPDRGGDLDLRRKRMDLAARLREVLMDVCRERLQRRDVDDPDLVRQATRLYTLAQELVERREEGGKRLAGARRRGDQRVIATTDRAPAVELRFGGFSAAGRKAAGPPLAQDRMKIEG